MEGRREHSCPITILSKISQNGCIVLNFFPHTLPSYRYNYLPLVVAIGVHSRFRRLLIHQGAVPKTTGTPTFLVKICGTPMLFVEICPLGSRVSRSVTLYPAHTNTHRCSPLILIRIDAVPAILRTPRLFVEIIICWLPVVINSVGYCPWFGASEEIALPLPNTSRLVMWGSHGPFWWWVRTIINKEGPGPESDVSPILIRPGAVHTHNKHEIYR